MELQIKKYYSKNLFKQISKKQYRRLKEMIVIPANQDKPAILNMEETVKPLPFLQPVMVIQEYQSHRNN
jgi:hypothetical protein